MNKVGRENSKKLVVLVNEIVDVKFFKKFFDKLKERKKIKSVDVSVGKIQDDYISQIDNVKMIIKGIIGTDAVEGTIEDNTKEEINIIYFYNSRDVANEESYNIPNCIENIEALKNEISHVNNVLIFKIDESIEDWIIIDKKGICQYLSISNDIDITSLNGNNGIEQIEELFDMNFETYEKGQERKLIDCLDINYIIDNIEEDIEDILKMI